MGRRVRSVVGLMVASLVAASGCVSGAVSPIAPKASRKPVTTATKPATGVPAVASGALAAAIAGLPTRVVETDGAPTLSARLTGKVKLISDNGGGIISDNGGGIISNNSGAIISDNGGGIISDNGGGIIANNGGAYRLAQSPPRPTEYGLAEAIITVHDASGRVLLDAAGKPITTTSDRQGNYTLAGELPRENLILAIKLWKGGTLSAMITRDAAAAAVDLDTASSIGAAYVLGQYVQGKQATFDKLPGSEAVRLHKALDDARGLVATAPKYDDAELVALGETIRGKAPEVDKTLSDIKALLLGQANLGAGRVASSVPLLGPRAMTVGPDGTLYVVEGAFGRIRAIAEDGTISTFADTVRGVVKQNFAEARDIVAAPDGSFYVSTPADGRVWHILPDHRVEIVAGSGVEGVATVGTKATETPLKPHRLALGPDGTLYIGEGHAEPTAPPRVFALGADGILRLAFQGEHAGAGINGLAVLADGFAYIETTENSSVYTDRLMRRWNDGRTEELPAPDVNRDLAAAPDGTLYVSRKWEGRVGAHRPDGTTRIVAGKASGLAASEALRSPTALTIAPDGTLYVLDDSANVVYRLAPDGGWSAVAGTTGTVIEDGDLGALPLNGPVGVAIAPDGSMVVSEDGSGLIRRFDGKVVTTIAGGMPYEQAVNDLTQPGEGIPALGSCLSLPRGLAYAGDELLIMDTGSHRLRALAPDGTIRTKVGMPGIIARQEPGHEPGHPFYVSPAMTATVEPGQTQAAGDHIFEGSCVAVGPDGLPAWTAGKANQVLRLRADGRVEGLTGVAPKGIDLITIAFTELADGAPATEWKPAFPSGLAFSPAGDLYVAETVTGQVRKLSGLATGAPTVSTFAGLTPSKLLAATPGQTGDGGPASEAPLVAPIAVCFDKAGNLYVGEVGTRSIAQLTSVFGSEIPMPPGVEQVDARVRKITPAGVITTVAGPGGKFFTDPTAEDALILPTGLAVDAQGRLFIVDTGSNLVRILPAGKF